LYKCVCVCVFKTVWNSAQQVKLKRWGQTRTHTHSALCGLWLRFM